MRGETPRFQSARGFCPRWRANWSLGCGIWSCQYIEQVDRSAKFIAERAEHIRMVAARLETERVLSEVTLVRDRIAVLEDLLRNAEE